MKLHLLSLLKLRVPPWDSGNNNNKVFSSWSWPLTSCSVKQMIVTSCPVSCTWQGIYWVQIVFYHAAHTAHCHAFQGAFMSLLSNQLFERFFFKVRKGHPDEHSLSFSSIISWTENWHWGRISCVTTCSVPALPKSLHVFDDLIIKLNGLGYFDVFIKIGRLSIVNEETNWFTKKISCLKFRSIKRAVRPSIKKE